MLLRKGELRSQAQRHGTLERPPALCGEPVLMTKERTLFVSESATDRLRCADEFVSRFKASTEILVVGASREAADDFVRLFSRDRGATFGLHRLSLTQLVARLAERELTAASIVPAPNLSTEALATLSVFEASTRNELKYFAPVAEFPGFNRSLARTLGELRVADVSPEALRTARDAGPDLAGLLEALAAHLSNYKLADRSLLFEAATRAALDGTGTPWVVMPLLLLDVEIRSKAQVDLIHAVVSKASSCLATVPSGDELTLRGLTSIKGLKKTEIERSQDQSSSLNRLKSYLFSEEAPPKEPDDSARIFSAPGEGREAVEIARFILDEARAGVPFDEIAVFVRTPKSYTPYLQTAFRRAGIPAYFARGTLRPDPAGRAFLALLHCAADGLSARRFAEYLSFAQVPSLDETGAPPELHDPWEVSTDEALGVAAEAARATADSERVEEGGIDSEREESKSSGAPVRAGSLRAPWKWESLLVEAAVIGGADRWRRRLDGLEHQVQFNLNELESEEPDSPRCAHLKRELEDLQHLKRFAMPVIERLDSFPAKTSWDEWLEHLNLLASTVLRRPERVLRVLADLEPMAAVGSVGLDQVCEVLSERLCSLEEDPPAQRFGRIFVAPPELARGRSFSIVFVPGLAERIFPQRPREDPLLLDHARRELSNWLDTQDQRSGRERLLLRLAIGTARDRAYLSHPRIDALEGRARVTSFYGLDVTRAIRGEIPALEKLERDADALTGARLAWPAPPEPSRAIDSVENDLAVLRQLLHDKDPTAAKGRAQYLVELHDCLGRSLRSRYARWQQKSWSELDGLVNSSDGIKDALAANRLTARPYSPSALERYAACPYRFLLSAIHRLEPREEVRPIEQLDPLTRGRLFHEVQAMTLRALKRKQLLPLTAQRLDEARTILTETLQQISGRYFDDLAPAITRVWEDEITSIRADLLMWLQAVARDATWQPEYFEFSFGLPRDASRDPASVKDVVKLPGGFLLRGAVDLIEKRSHSDAVRVTDHKTGADRTTPGLIIGGGSTLQPVLYGLAVEKALQKTVEQSRLFFCTSRGGFSEPTVSMNAQAREQAGSVLGLIDRAIADGMLPPAPSEGACDFCDFRIVCGPYEEERARRKTRDPLKTLHELRKRQ